MSTNNLIPSTSAGGFSTAGNVVAGNISATANITAANFATSGNGGNITGANVVSANTFSMLQNSTITEVASPVPGNFAIALSSLGTVSGDQQLLVYPTTIEANHLHLTSGNLYNTELFLGNDDLYVKLANTGNVVINSNDNAGNTAQVTLDTKGNLHIPGNIAVSGSTTVPVTNENGNPGGPGAATLTAHTNANPGETNIQVGWTVTGNNLVGTTTVTAVNDLGSGVLEFVTDTAVTNPFWYNDVYTFTGTSDYVWNFVGATLNVPGNGTITTLNSTSGAAGNDIGIQAGSADQVTYNTSPGGNVNIAGGLGGFSDGSGSQGGAVNISAGLSADPAGVAGNVTINSSTSTWTFDNNGMLSLPSGGTLTTGNLTIGAANGIGTISTIIEDDGELYVYATANGTVTTGWANSYPSSGEVATISFNQVSNEGNAVIQTGNAAGISYEWIFDNVGNLTLPANTFSVNYANGDPVIIGGTPTIIANGLSNVSIPTANGTITFGVNGYSYGNIGSGVAIGYLAGNSGFQTSGIAIGTSAGTSNQGLHGIAMGWNTGMFTQGNSTVAIGENAAYTNQGNFAIAVGAVAGREGQSANAIAIGTRAGYVSQGGRSIAIGSDAGNTSQGADSIAIGTTAGLDTQGINSVAIGVYAGNISQGGSSVAVGGEAGQSSQGVNSVAVGLAAGAKGQGNAATALGFTAGQYSQGGFAVAVGSGAAYTNQGLGAIAIGADASPINQGGYSIAIGSGALFGNIQANNSILIDATGTGNIGAPAAGLYVAPVRNDTGNTTNVVYYNTTSKEVTYGPATAGNVSFLANSAATLTLANSGELLVASNGTASNYVVNSTTPDIDLRNASGTGSYTQGSTQYVMRVAGSNNLVLDNTGLLSAPGAISAVGNVRGININTVGLVTATGNVYGANFIGNGSTLSNVSIANGSLTSSPGNVQLGNLIARIAGTGNGSYPQITTNNAANSTIIWGGYTSDFANTTAGSSTIGVGSSGTQVAPGTWANVAVNSAGANLSIANVGDVCSVTVSDFDNSQSWNVTYQRLGGGKQSILITKIA